jgi:hypothetical protein
MSDTRDIEQLYCERCKRIHAFGYERTMGTMVQLASCHPGKQSFHALNAECCDEANVTTASD